MHVSMCHQKAPPSAPPLAPHREALGIHSLPKSSNTLETFDYSITIPIYSLEYMPLCPIPLEDSNKRM
jgi:hypothetical protein